MSDDDKFQRAVVLIQLLLNIGLDDWFEVEREAREQLAEWGIDVPEWKD